MRLVSRALFSGSHLSARLSRAGNYLAVGTLRLSEMKDAIRESWEGFYARDEDVASGLMDWERDLVDRFVPPGATVLVVGAGSGRDVVPLVERGCEVTGVEPAVTSLEVARRVLRERHLGATLLEGFFEDVDLSGHFDVVIFSFYSYSYIPQSRRRIAALRKAAGSLTANGHILVSYPPLQAPHQVLIAWAAPRVPSAAPTGVSSPAISSRRTAAAFAATLTRFNPASSRKRDVPPACDVFIAVTIRIPSLCWPPR